MSNPTRTEPAEPSPFKLQDACSRCGSDLIAGCQLKTGYGYERCRNCGTFWVITDGKRTEPDVPLRDAPPAAASAPESSPFGPQGTRRFGARAPEARPDAELARLVEELDALAAKLTVGEWRDVFCHWGKSSVDAMLPTPISGIESWTGSTINGQPCTQVAPPSLAPDDAAFMARVRNAWPVLSAALRQAATVREELERAHATDVQVVAAKWEGDLRKALEEREAAEHKWFMTLQRELAIKNAETTRILAERDALKKRLAEIQRAFADACEWSSRMAFRNGLFSWVEDEPGTPPYVPWLSMLESQLQRFDELNRKVCDGELVPREELPTTGIAKELYETKKRLGEAEALLKRIHADEHSHLLFAIDDLERWCAEKGPTT